MRTKVYLEKLVVPPYKNVDINFNHLEEYLIGEASEKFFEFTEPGRYGVYCQLKFENEPSDYYAVSVIQSNFAKRIGLIKNMWKNHTLIAMDQYTYGKYFTPTRMSKDKVNYVSGHINANEKDYLNISIMSYGEKDFIISPESYLKIWKL